MGRVNYREAPGRYGEGGSELCQPFVATGEGSSAVLRFVVDSGPIGGNM